MELIHLTKAAQRFPRVAQAIQLFREAHDSINQKRKYTFEPYWVHTEEVADTFLSYFPDDEDGAIIALGHDYDEDVVTKLKEEKRLKELTAFDARVDAFGQAVRSGITDLTDVFVKENYPDLNRKERKVKELERIKTIPVRSKNIKLCDLISNTASIVRDDPDFAKVYIREKEAALYVLTDADGQLLSRSGQQVWDARKVLGFPQPLIKAQ
jgi:guanosine-3',5'-bis(diphosphate) 3'-pyrophosphohydrolase